LYNQSFKLIAFLIAIPIIVIGGAVYRERRGKELSKAEWGDVVNKANLAAIIVIMFILAIFFYINNRPW
jgi:amino acid transporter